MMKAPWTTQEVEALNYMQHCGMLHPYTCDRRNDGNHPDNAVLVPTKDGWVCPHCSYKQDWFRGDVFELIEGVKTIKKMLAPSLLTRIGRKWKRYLSGWW